MKRVALVLILAVTPAVADECDVLAERVSSKVGATIRTRIEEGFKLEHPAAPSLQVDCRAGRLVRVGGMKISPGGVLPFVRTIARLTSATFAVNEKSVTQTMRGCMRQSARGTGTVQKVSGKGLALECLVLGDEMMFLLERR